MIIQGKTAIITGGGRGIGRAVALRLARDGAAVVLAGRDARPLDDSAAEVTREGGRALAVAADVSREDHVRRLADEARGAFGPIDVLVNNAAVTGPTAPLAQLARADWDEVLAVNLTGAFLCCRAAVPDMTARRAGKIINVSSVAGRSAYPLRSPYAASKWGLIGLTVTLAQELGEHNVQVNAVCPGPVEGERMRRVIRERAQRSGRPEDEVERGFVSATALKRMASEEDVAALVAFLASPAADNITGQVIDVSAGFGL